MIGHWNQHRQITSSFVELYLSLKRSDPKQFITFLEVVSEVFDKTIGIEWDQRISCHVCKIML